MNLSIRQIATFREVSHLLQGPQTTPLTIRRFRPRISNSVSILTPGYVTQALIAQAFSQYLEEAIETMQHRMDALLCTS